MVFYNTTDIKNNVDGERKAQPYMDTFYRKHGWATVDRSLSCKKFDCELRTNGSHKRVEEKFRTGDFGDFAIEIKQRTEQPSQDGWFYEIECDYLVYVVCENENTWKPVDIYRIYWNRFKTWLLNEYLIEHKFQRAMFSDKGIGLSMNLIIAWEKIPGDLYDKFFFA